LLDTPRRPARRQPTEDREANWDLEEFAS